MLRTLVLCVAGFALGTAQAGAAAHLVLKKSIALVERSGGAERLVPSERTAVAPGGRLRITIAAANDGDRPAQNVTIRESIERDQIFAGSADPAAHVEYSLDNGKSWSSAPTVKVQTPNGLVERKALPSEYTALRWVEQPAIPPSGKATFTYDVILK
jgi:uncharacterized repeat protein (TIGR01451 family)